MAAVIDFNEDWEFCLDTDQIGLDKRWHVNKPKEAIAVSLPHTWPKNTQKSGDNVGFYFKTITFSDPTEARKVVLKLEKVFMQFSLWVNGVFVEEVLSGYRPVEVHLTKFIDVEKENSLCIRVSTGNGTQDFEGKPSCDIAFGSLFEQSPFGGIWGKAQLMYWKKSCILDINVVPDIDAKKIRVESRFSNSKNYSALIHYVITSPSGQVGMHTIEAKLDKENMIHKIQFNMKDFAVWTLENPLLYTIEVYLDMSFGITKRFGIKKTDVLSGDFYLNDKIIKIKGINFTPSYPITAALPETKDTLRTEIYTIKELGFNLIKSGGSPLSDEALDLCDEVGLFVIQEMPIYKQKASKEALEYARVFIEDIINAQKTHPSVIAWSLGSDNGTLMLENGTKLLKHTDTIDETRVVFSNLNAVYISADREYKADTGKILGVTNEKVSLYNSHKLFPQMGFGKDFSHFLNQYCNKNSEVNSVPNNFFGDEEFHDNYEYMYKGLTGKILISTNNHTIFPDFKSVYKHLKNYKNSDEYKKLFALEKELKRCATEDIFSKNWSTYEEFLEVANAISLESTINKINVFRSNEQTSGFILENWADTKQILNGFTDTTRELKCDKDALKHMTSVSQVIMHTMSRSVEVKSTITFDLTLLNEVRVAPFALTIQLLDASKKVMCETVKEVVPEGLVYSIGTITMSAPEKEGIYTLTATIEKNPSQIGTFSEDILVLNTIKDFSSKYLNLTHIQSDDDLLAAIAKETKAILVTEPHTYNESIQQALFDAAESGVHILFINLNPEDVEALNTSRRLPSRLIIESSTGATSAAFHYFSDSPLFKDMKHTRIADSTMGEIIPVYSLEKLKGAHKDACCLILSQSNDITQLVDVQSIQYGKGTITFNQYQLINTLETSIVAKNILSKYF